MKRPAMLTHRLQWDARAELPHEPTSPLGRRARIMRGYVLLALACALACSANAQFVQQGGKLVGTGAVGIALQGNSVALSADGNTAIVGGPDDNINARSSAGAAWVYTRSGGVWTQQGGKLVGAGTDGSDASQGTSVALSADGNTALVGGPYAGIPYAAGGVWVYTRSGGAWTQQGGALVGTGAGGPSSGQGYSVALSSDGNTALVGGPDDNSSPTNGSGGAAWVYTRSGGVWTQQGTKLVGTGAVGNAWQGFSVALSADGNTAIVGGPDDNGRNSDAVGAAWVYTRSGGVWTQQGTKLVGTGAVGNAFQGYSVALSSDGNTAIVGGPWDNVNAYGSAGAAWVYTRSGGVWTQQGTKLVGTGAASPFAPKQGYSVALSGDGNKAIVGGPFDSAFFFFGATWVYTRSGGVWTQQGCKLAGTGAAGSPMQGYSVALSADGNTAIVGGPDDGGGYGAAWVFVSAPANVSAPWIACGGVVPVDSTVTTIQPGEWVSIFGTSLAGSTVNWNGNFPTSLGGTSVMINGKAAYLSYVGPKQINLQAPDDKATGIVPVVVTTVGGSSTASVTLAQFGPSFFLLDAKHVAGIIVRSDGSGAYGGGTYDIIGPTGTSLGYPTVAAKAGDIVEIYGTGLGPTNPAVPAGQVFSGAAPTTNPVKLLINDVGVTPMFAGLSGAGLYQINLSVPAGLGTGDVSLVATVGGAQTPPTVVISLQ